MDLYKSLISDDELINYFCDIMEDNISTIKGYKVIINFKKHDNSIFFFLDGSSILQIMPDKNLQYTYANSPSYESVIEFSLKMIEKQYKRDQLIEQIIKKES